MVTTASGSLPHTSLGLVAVSRCTQCRRRGAQEVRSTVQAAGSMEHRRGKRNTVQAAGSTRSTEHRWHRLPPTTSRHVVQTVGSTGGTEHRLPARTRRPEWVRGLKADQRRVGHKPTRSVPKCSKITLKECFLGAGRRGERGGPRSGVDGGQRADEPCDGGFRLLLDLARRTDDLHALPRPHHATECAR